MTDWPGQPVATDKDKQQWPGQPKKQVPPEDNRGTFEKIATYQTWPERLIGGAISGIGESLKAGATLTKEALTDPKQYSKDVQDPAKVLPAASLGVTAAPTAALGSPLASWGKSLSRTAEEDVQNRAVGKVTSRLEQGGTTAADAIKQVDEGNAAGKPMTLADVGGKPTERLAGSVYRSGGEASNTVEKFLNERDKAAGSRLDQDISQYVHGGQGMYRTTQHLFDARSQEGKPLWDQVRGLQGVWSPRLQEFLDDSLLKRGMARGYEIERGESLAEGRPFNPTQMGVDLDAEGNIKIVAAPNMRVLHMGKVGLDMMIEEAKDKFGRPTNMSVMLDKLRRSYLETVDGLDSSGIYKKARDAWGGRTSSLMAVKNGRDIFTSSPDEIASEFAKLSTNDKEFYRVGVADKLREQLGKTGVSGDEAKSILKNPWVEKQLAPIFPTPGEFDKFVDQVTRESRMFRTNVKTMGGSQTAERLAADEETTGETLLGAADIGKSAMSGNWLSAINKAIRMKRDLGLRQDPALNERIAKLLFSTEPDLTTVEMGTSGRGGLMRAAAPALNQATPALVPGAASALAGRGN